MTWLRVLSSGEIADAASVLVNAMGRRHRRGRQRLRSSWATTWEEGPARKGSAPFRFELRRIARREVSERFPWSSIKPFAGWFGGNGRQNDDS